MNLANARNIATRILQVVYAADTAFGHEVSNRLLDFLAQDQGLTPEQNYNIAQNLASYRAQIAKLDAEIARDTAARAKGPSA